MQDDEPLTADQCDELSRALHEDAAGLASGCDKENLVKLAAAYSALADIKRVVLQQVN